MNHIHNTHFLRAAHLRKSFFLTLTFFCFANTHADEETQNQLATPNSGLSIFDTQLLKNPETPRSFFWPQFASFILPGFDQWLEGQVPAGLFYSGIALGGLGAASYAQSQYTMSANPKLATESNPERTYLLGMQLTMAAGGMSAYASFRSAVHSQKIAGNFLFLKSEETVGDLLLAPFKFREVLKPSSYVPLLLALVLIATPTESAGRLTFSDVFFTSAFSLNAGTHEEAVFRGWLMPIGMHYMDNRFLSNAAQAGIFGAMHISKENPYPIFQTLMGFYLGHLTQRNQWTLTQSVFVHTWWDIVLFGGSYFHNRIRSSKGLATREIFLPFPPVALVF